MDNISLNDVITIIIIIAIVGNAIIQMFRKKKPAEIQEGQEVAGGEEQGDYSKYLQELKEQFLKATQQQLPHPLLPETPQNKTTPPEQQQFEVPQEVVLQPLAPIPRGLTEATETIFSEPQSVSAYGRFNDRVFKSMQLSEAQQAIVLSALLGPPKGLSFRRRLMR